MPPVQTHMTRLSQAVLANDRRQTSPGGDHLIDPVIAVSSHVSAFPRVFTSSLVRHELVADYSHLFWVQGSQPELDPYLLLAHIDVVPATESDGWEAPPFSAQEINGFIYGRGTMDDKCSLMV